MYRGAVVRAFLYHAVVDRQVAWQLACGVYNIVCDDDIAGAVVKDADDGTVLHGLACKVAHALAGALAVEIASFQVG